MPNTDDDAPPDMKVARQPRATLHKPAPIPTFMQRIWTGAQVIAALAVFIVVAVLIQKCHDTLTGYQ